MPPRRVLLAYHFFHPDDVVSARLFTDLALGLHERGWDVTALASNRAWADPAARHPGREDYAGVRIERVHRPAWTQSRPLARLANSAWMLAAWARRAASLGKMDAVVVGSDPAFAAMVVLPWRRLWPDAAIAHWCYDVYPEVIVANGGGVAVGAAAPVARRMMASAYRRFDALVDIGPGMRSRLDEYATRAVRATVPPWALIEPEDAPRSADARVRRELFGDARLGLLYSGTLGRAHDVQSLLDLARACRRRSGPRIAFCFSGRGHRARELEQSLRTDDVNVRIAGFCDERRLGTRLEAADLHLISLQPEWAGLVVPSKFFASLAVGRPVVYAGPQHSDVARWIASLDVGYELRPETTGAVVEALHRLADEPSMLLELQRRCRRAYDEQFRRQRGIDAWDGLLRQLTDRSS